MAESENDFSARREFSDWQINVPATQTGVACFGIGNGVPVIGAPMHARRAGSNNAKNFAFTHARWLARQGPDFHSVFGFLAAVPLPYRLRAVENRAILAAAH